MICEYLEVPGSSHLASYQRQHSWIRPNYDSLRIPMATSRFCVLPQTLLTTYLDLITTEGPICFIPNILYYVLYLKHLTKPFDDESKCTDYGLQNQILILMMMSQEFLLVNYIEVLSFLPFEVNYWFTILAGSHRDLEARLPKVISSSLSWGAGSSENLHMFEQHIIQIVRR